MKPIAIATALLALSACATVTRGTKESFYVLSDPDGANVALSNGQKCVAPCAIKLKRNKEFDATYTLAGYSQRRSTSAPAYAGVVSARRPAM